MEFKLTKPKEKCFFLIVLPIALAIEWAFAATQDWSAYPHSEWVALIDLCVFMPLVYLSLFSSGLRRKTRLLRAAGIAGAGLFASSFIVPDANQFMISELSSIKNAMLVFILVFEAWILGKVVNAVYRKGADAKALKRDFAMPERVARLMIIEAKFWKSVWGFLRRK